MSNHRMIDADELGRYGFFQQRGKFGVLLIHGVTGTPREMKLLARSLAAGGFTIACPQLAGHCSSLTELKATRWTDWYASAVAGLDFLKARCDKVFVVGLSMGALIALKLAASRPQDVAGVASLSTTFFYDGWNVPRLRRRFLLPLAIYSPLRYFVSYKEPAPYGIKDERMRNLVAMVYSGNERNIPEMYGYSEFPGVTVRESADLIKSVKQSLQDVFAPTLIVHATEDDMASVENARYLAARLGSTRIESCYLDDTYHVLTLDRRKDDVASSVVEFFTRCTLRASAHAETSVDAALTDTIPSISAAARP